MSHEKSKQVPSGFTVVEALAAIGVLAILIAMVVPAISGVRRAADLHRCTSHLRTIAGALSLYAQEHRTLGPVWSEQRAYTSQSAMGTPTAIADYLGPYLGADRVPADGRNTAKIYIPYFICPVSEKIFLKQGEMAAWTCYIYQSTVIDGERYRPFGSRSPLDGPMNLNTVPHPSKIKVLADNDFGPSAVAQPPAHGGVSNTLFFDGHVQSQPPL